MTPKQKEDLAFVCFATAVFGGGMFFGVCLSENRYIATPPPTFTRAAYAGMDYLADQLKQERPRFPLTDEGLVYRAWSKFVKDQVLEPMEPREKQLYDCAFEAAVNQCANGFILQGPIIVPCGGTISNLTVTLVRGQCAFSTMGDGPTQISYNKIYMVP